MTVEGERFEPESGMVMPRFAGPATFMRLPQVSDPAAVDIALVGVPWDGGTTNRAGARHGPREIRNMSAFMRRIHPTSRIAPYELCRVADLGDVSVNPIDLMDTLGRVEGFTQRQADLVQHLHLHELAADFEVVGGSGGHGT